MKERASPSSDRTAGYLDSELVDALSKNEELNDPEVIEDLLEEIESSKAAVVLETPAPRRRARYAAGRPRSLPPNSKRVRRRGCGAHGRVALLSNAQEIALARRMETPRNDRDFDGCPERR